MASLIPGIGPTELIIVLVIVLLLFGPKRLPQLGKSLGKTVKAIREGVDGKDEDAAETDADAETTKAKEKKSEEAKVKPETPAEDEDEA